MTDVVAGILVRDGRLLLAQRRPDQDFPLTWECPGGKVERGEVHHDALRREWEEELGLKLGDIDPSPLWRGEFHGAVQVTRADRAAVTVYFYVIWAAEGEPRSREGQGLGWFRCGEVRVLTAAPALTRAMEEVLRLLRSWEEAHGSVLRGRSAELEDALRRIRQDAIGVEGTFAARVRMHVAAALSDKDEDEKK